MQFSKTSMEGNPIMPMLCCLGRMGLQERLRKNWKKCSTTIFQALSIGFQAIMPSRREY